MVHIKPGVSHSVKPTYVVLKPSQIKCFKRASSTRLSSGCDVLDLLRQILYGYVNVDDLTCNNIDGIKVVYMKGTYWINDGLKRLWVLQTLEEMGKLHTIKVKVNLRRDYTQWNTMTSGFTPKKKVTFRFLDQGDKYNFMQKLGIIKDEIEEKETKEIQPPSAGRFYFVTPITERVRICAQAELRRFYHSQDTSWFDLKVMVLIALLWIALIVLFNQDAFDSKTFRSIIG